LINSPALDWLNYVVNEDAEDAHDISLIIIIIRCIRGSSSSLKAPTPVELRSPSPPLQQGSNKALVQTNWRATGYPVQMVYMLLSGNSSAGVPAAATFQCHCHDC